MLLGGQCAFTTGLVLVLDLYYALDISPPTAERGLHITQAGPYQGQGLGIGLGLGQGLLLPQK